MKNLAIRVNCWWDSCKCVAGFPLNPSLFALHMNSEVLIVVPLDFLLSECFIFIEIPSFLWKKMKTLPKSMLINHHFMRNSKPPFRKSF